MEEGRIGVWTTQLGLVPAVELRELARELERTGFSNVWIPESTWADPFVLAAMVLAATERITVSTGIARLHGRVAQTMVNGWAALNGFFPDRFVLGLGVSHRPAVERVLGAQYAKPLDAMRTYLDELDAASYLGHEPAPRRRMLAALGPRMLALAAERSAGAHPYNAPLEHTTFARGVLGTGPLLIPEVKVLFEQDPATARRTIREAVGPSLALPNYANNLARFGYSLEDVAARADGVVDSLVAWGDDAGIAARVQAHLDAGADQVAVQVLSADGGPPAEGWRRLAAALS